jgi:hypothetical protein
MPFENRALVQQHVKGKADGQDQCDANNSLYSHSPVEEPFLMPASVSREDD